MVSHDHWNLGCPQQGMRKWTDEMQSKTGLSHLCFRFNFYCLLLETPGTVTNKHLLYFGKHHPKIEVNNKCSLSQIFAFNL